MRGLPVMCDRHWDTQAVGLFRVAQSGFGLDTWMCSLCRIRLALKQSVQSLNKESRRRVSLAERKTIGE